MNSSLSWMQVYLQQILCSKILRFNMFIAFKSYVQLQRPPVGMGAKVFKNIIPLKGLCQQIRMTWKWYCCKGLVMDMRRLIFKKFLREPPIFNRHLKFLCLGSKRVQIFHFVLNLNWGCSKWVQIALFASWNNSDFQCLFWLAVWFPAFFTTIALFSSWKLLELLYSMRHGNWALSGTVPYKFC
jgi:hypothetical protein